MSDNNEQSPTLRATIRNTARKSGPDIAVVAAGGAGKIGASHLINLGLFSTLTASTALASTSKVALTVGVAALCTAGARYAISRFQNRNSAVETGKETAKGEAACNSTAEMLADAGPLSAVLSDMAGGASTGTEEAPNRRKERMRNAAEGAVTGTLKTIVPGGDLASTTIDALKTFVDNLRKALTPSSATPPLENQPTPHEVPPILETINEIEPHVANVLSAPPARSSTHFRDLVSNGAPNDRSFSEAVNADRSASTAQIDRPLT